MAILANRVAVSTATTGTGTVTLGTELSGFCTFAEAGVSDGDLVTYILTEGDDFEIGRGTYTSSGTTLSRDTVLLSKISGTSGTTKMTLGGSAEVRVMAAAEDMESVGTVSQSGGVPTGAIIETGSGSNGRFVKFADGMMICTHKLTGLGPINNSHGSNFFHGPFGWTFPATFAAAPVVLALPAGGASLLWVGANGAPSTTAQDNFLVFRSSSDSSTSVVVDVTAIGRWF